VRMRSFQVAAEYSINARGRGQHMCLDLGGGGRDDSGLRPSGLMAFLFAPPTQNVDVVPKDAFSILKPRMQQERRQYYTANCPLHTLWLDVQLAALMTAKAPASSHSPSFRIVPWLPSIQPPMENAMLFSPLLSRNPLQRKSSTYAGSPHHIAIMCISSGTYRYLFVVITFYRLTRHLCLSLCI